MKNVVVSTQAQRKYSKEPPAEAGVAKSQASSTRAAARGSVVLLMSFFTCSFANSNPVIDQTQQLKQVTVSIQAIQTNLDSEKSQRKEIQSDLAASEIAVNEANQSIYKLNRALAKEEQNLSLLNAQAAQNQQKLNDAQTHLAMHLKTAYILGLQPYLKLILNQQDPNELSRVLQYYRYFNQKRIDALMQLRAAGDELNKTLTYIQAKQTDLQNIKQKLTTEEQTLSAAQNERKTAVENLNQSIQTQMQQLTNLLANKEALLRALHGLQQTYSVNGLDFGKYRGKLPWPTSGRVLRLFGTPINNSQLRWDGTLIVAPESTPVHAVASGKVVFAKWLAGYGFLMIIDHGNGYMTLYGRNHALYQEVGDQVNAGDVIASVGKSGGYDTPALYFSIRHDAKPLNPMRWCH